MRKYVVIIGMLASGLVLGATVFREPVAWAAQAIDANIVNVDANGNVKVHEQGVAKVTIADAVVPTAATGRVVVLASDVAATGSYETRYVDTSGCSQAIVFYATPSSESLPQASLETSPDGAVPAGSWQPSVTSAAKTGSGLLTRTLVFNNSAGQSVVAPYSRVYFFAAGDFQITKAWLYCAP